MQIFFNDGTNVAAEATLLDYYLSQCPTFNGNIIFGQTGGRVLDATLPSDRNSLIALQVIQSSFTPEYQIISQQASQQNADAGTTGLNTKTYNSSTRGDMEGILSKKVLYFVYDLVSNDNALQLTVNNQFGEPVADMINQFLNNPISQIIGTIGGGTGSDLAGVLNAIGGVFGLKSNDISDIFSTLFLSKVKTVKLWQGGNISFQIPAQFTFLDYNGDPFNNVILPTFLLYLIAGYNRIPFGALSDDSSTVSSWLSELGSILRFVIGPMYFKLQIGNFLESDNFNPFAISQLDVKYSQFINGLPSVQKVSMTIENINPIVIEDIPGVGEQDEKPIVQMTQDNNVYNFNFPTRNTSIPFKKMGKYTPE